jgi:hypothetical protein
MGEIAIASKISEKLHLDRLIEKLEFGLLGFGVGYLGGTLIECIESGQGISWNCFVSNLASNWLNDLENFWLNFTPIGIIINNSGVLDYNYKHVLGKATTLSCKDSQVSHLSSCYNKDEIPQDFGFVAFNPIDWK